MCRRNHALFEELVNLVEAKALGIAKNEAFCWREVDKLSPWSTAIDKLLCICSHLLKILGHLSTVLKLRVECVTRELVIRQRFPVL